MNSQKCEFFLFFSNFNSQKIDSIHFDEKWFFAEKLVGISFLFAVLKFQKLLQKYQFSALFHFSIFSIRNCKKRDQEKFFKNFLSMNFFEKKLLGKNSYFFSSSQNHQKSIYDIIFEEQNEINFLKKICFLKNSIFCFERISWIFKREKNLFIYFRLFFHTFCFHK